MAILLGRKRKLMWRRITTVGGAGGPVRHEIPLGTLISLVLSKRGDVFCELGHRFRQAS